MNSRTGRVAGVVWALLALCAGGLAAQAVLHEQAGDNGGEGLGASVAVAGDVNGDGFADLIVGGPGYGPSGTPVTGRVLIVAGQSGAVLYQVLGSAEGDDFGRAVAGAGDVDGDGLDDVIVGAPGADLLGTNSGLASVLSGATGSALFTWSGDSAWDGFGSAVAGAGDVDGDGRSDVIVGAPTDDPHGTSSGSARVISGATGSTLLLITGDSAYDLCGQSVAGAGDVDHDGHADLLVGEPTDVAGGLTVGTVRLVSGATGATLFAWHGTADGDEFGWAVAAAGDVDGDGTPDIAVGARLDDSSAVNAGAAFLYSGATGALLRSYHGLAAGDLFGSAVFGAGDMNADGRPELLVGAPHDHCDGSNCGATSVYSGATGELLYEYHGTENQQMGNSVGGGGDCDGDGHDDIVVGLSFADSINGLQAGLAREYSATAWLNLTQGTSGSAQGLALFSGQGSLKAQQPFTLSLSGAPTLAPSMLVVGLSVINAPFKGATMVPHPDLVSTAMPTDVAGELTLAGLWPAGLPADLAITMQWWSLDPGSDGGFRASNALQAITQ